MTATTPDSNAIITCRNVSIAYGRQEVIHDVSMEIARGSFLPFVGPNGAGKTTLLRAILGLIRPRRGEIITPFRTSPPGYVPQHRTIDPLYPVSVRQITAMGLYPKLGWWRRGSKKLRRTVLEALEEFGLGDHADKTFSELSGGMKQKAMLARAFVSGAEIFIMDEPTSQLDEESEKEVFAHLLRLSRREGKTVLMAVHGMHEVLELPQRVCLVEHGRVRLAETSDVFPARPAPHGINGNNAMGGR
ncbi:MAG: ABC transporter ATP-binding protein [bacterium]|nr:ABC transporter ATP-binding protein [bacterium]